MRKMNSLDEAIRFQQLIDFRIARLHHGTVIARTGHDFGTERKSDSDPINEGIFADVAELFHRFKKRETGSQITLRLRRQRG